MRIVELIIDLTGIFVIASISLVMIGTIIGLAGIAIASIHLVATGTIHPEAFVAWVAIGLFLIPTWFSLSESGMGGERARSGSLLEM